MIDWSKAPEWAKYAAMDEDGDWFWYEDEPSPGSRLWVASSRAEYITGPSRSWLNSLTERPKD